MIIKTQEQYNKLKKAGKILAEILTILENDVKPGVSSLDIENKARELIEKFNAKPATLGYKPDFAKKAYPAATCVSVNEVIVHGIPNEKPRVFNEGDIVSIDCVIEYEGVFVDAAITTGVGEIAEKDRKLIEANKKARDDAIAIVKAGIRVGEIGKFLDNFAKKHGYSLPKELGGHGIGESIHEKPFIGNYDGAPYSDYILQENEVITIEPMMSSGTAKLILLDDGYSYKVADNSNTAHFEHTLIVRKDGPEILTVL